MSSQKNIHTGEAKQILKYQRKRTFVPHQSRKAFFGYGPRKTGKVENMGIGIAGCGGQTAGASSGQ
jgi:hypothetical protein